MGCCQSVEYPIRPHSRRPSLQHNLLKHEVEYAYNVDAIKEEESVNTSRITLPSDDVDEIDWTNEALEILEYVE